MATRDATARWSAAHPIPWPAARAKALICKTGPDEVLDRCLMALNGEVDVEQVETLAEGMQRCLQGDVDILFVNLFSVTAREMTALAAFRSLLPEQRVVVITGADFRPTVLMAGLADEVLEFDGAHQSSPRPARVQPRA